jgi:hypothetical protein
MWALNLSKHQSWHDSLKAVLFSYECRTCLLLATIPMTMSIINSSWLFTEISSLDPWVNVGYFLHYSDPSWGNWYYKIARLTWIIPGFITYHIFQPIVANCVLHLSYLILAILFFYLAVARLFNQSIAFVTAACFAVFTPFHQPGWFDYQNTPAGTYYLISFYLLTSAVLSKNSRAHLIAAGVAYGATLHATIGFVNMAPILVSHYVVLYRQCYYQTPARRVVLATFFWFLIGGAALTVLLGLVNLAVGRDFLFFRQLFEIVISSVQDSRGQAQWWIPLSTSWVGDINYMRYLGFGLVILVGCIVQSVGAIFRSRPNPIAVSLQLEYIYAAVLWIVWQMFGQTALEPESFAYPLYPVMFLALAAIAANWSNVSSPRRTYFSMYLVLAAVLISTLAFSLGDYLFHWPRQASLIVLALATVCVVFFAISRARLAFLMAGVLAYSEMNAFVAVYTGRNYALAEPCKDRVGAYGALIDAEDFLSRYVRNTNEMFLWWNQNEAFHDGVSCNMQVANFAWSLAALGLFNYLAPPWTGMPQAVSLPPSSFSNVTGARKIAVLTADYSNLEALLSQFKKLGVNLRINGETIIRTSRFAFNLYVLGLDEDHRDTMQIKTSGVASKILVRSATYGANCYAAIGNATNKLQAACGGKASCDYGVDVANLRDPVRGCEKEFTVEYTCDANGAARTARLPGEANGKSIYLSCR